MNREIKFRFFYKDKRIEDNLSLKEIGDRCAFRWDDEVAVVQYTGLKDKNGIEIYEGDILSNSDYDSWWNCEVVYKDGGFWTSEYELLFTTLEDNNCQVIGNIYENKELLKD